MGRFIFTVCLLFFCSGCLSPSLEPFYRQEDVTGFPQADGRWRHHDYNDQESLWKVEGDLAYLVKGDERRAAYDLVFFKIDDTVFLDISAASSS